MTLIIPEPKHWIYREGHALQADQGEFSQIRSFVRSAGLSDLVAELLILRGYNTLDRATTFLQPRMSHLPDPFLMKGMEPAATRIAEAVLSGETAYCSSDFDADGIASAAILMSFFRQIGAAAEYFIPHREEDGYGLSARMIQECAEQGGRLIVSTDCGISNHHEADLCRSLGIDLIITDHHQPPDTLPQGYAIVNPHQPDCPFPDKTLCGAGIAFYLTIALRKCLRDRGYFADRPEPNLGMLLDLVAVATVADLVPINSPVNRLFVKTGLDLISRRTRTGLCALRDVCDIKRVSAGTTGFQIGPRLNASGRLQTARLGVELMLADDYDQARALSQTLDELNEKRKEVEESTVARAIELIEQGGMGQASIVLADEAFAAPTVGIAASRLVELYHRPTILIAINPQKNEGKGSGRSIRGFSLIDALNETGHLLTKYGGHKAAAGLSIDPAQVPLFAAAFDKIATTRLTAQDLQPKAFYDMELPLSRLSESLVDSLDALAPFGMGNPAPVFLARDLTASQVRVLKDKHLKFFAHQADGTRISCIGFNLGHLAHDIAAGPFSMIFQASLNHWRGNIDLQCEVRDIKSAAADVLPRAVHK